jgi:hypothetical protein
MATISQLLTVQYILFYGTLRLIIANPLPSSPSLSSACVALQSQDHPLHSPVALPCACTAQHFSKIKKENVRHVNKK